MQAIQFANAFQGISRKDFNNSEYARRNVKERCKKKKKIVSFL